MSRPSVVCLNSLRNASVGIVGVRSAGVGRRSREARQRRASMLVLLIVTVTELELLTELLTELDLVLSITVCLHVYRCMSKTFCVRSM